MLKISPNISARILLLLHPPIHSFWVDGQLHRDIKEGINYNLPEKGDLTRCEHWRGIPLYSMVYKVIANILNGRLSTSLFDELKPEQAAFRPTRSCADHANSLKIIVKKSVGWRSMLYLTFLYFDKPFDVVDKITHHLKSLYSDGKLPCLHENQLGDIVAFRNGVRQGCPLLFVIVFDNIMAVRKGLR